jgi:Transglycosylase SLT domain
MGLLSNSGRRAAAASVALVMVLALAPFVARAQTQLEEAEGAKEQAEGLVSAAVANRAQVEAELLATLDSYQSLSFQLSSVSADLVRLSELIDATSTALSAARRSVDRQGVEAYMQALSMSGGMVWRMATIEDAMVAERTLSILAGAEEDESASLSVIERDLMLLDETYRVEFRNVQSLTLQVETEAVRLQDLFSLADSKVAIAIGEAMAADAAYRSALDEVERARAAEKQSEREAESVPTTTPIVTEATATTMVATTVPGATSRQLKPAVEQWRSLVAAYFDPIMVDQALSIIQCESLGDPGAYNPYSGASGLFQFLPGTWAVTSTRAGFGGADVFDPEANVAAAAWLASYYQASGRNPWTPWHCIP